MLEFSQGYPKTSINASYVPKTGEGIVEGMMVKLDTNGQLVKADGTAGETAFVATNSQPTGGLTASTTEQGGKVQVIKANATVGTDQFKSGSSYTVGGDLQVSVTSGEEGILIPHAASGAPIVGQFLRKETIRGTEFLFFDLIRS